MYSWLCRSLTYILFRESHSLIGSQVTLSTPLPTKSSLRNIQKKNRSQVRFVSISGRSGGQASCTDGLKSIQQEPSFQALWTQHHAQSIAEVSSVLVQNRFGDPLCRLQPQMTGIEIEKESMIPSRRTLQNLSRKQDELCIFGQMRIK